MEDAVPLTLECKARNRVSDARHYPCCGVNRTHPYRPSPPKSGPGRARQLRRFPTLTKTRRAPLFRRALVKGRMATGTFGETRARVTFAAVHLACRHRAAHSGSRLGSAPRARDSPWAWAMAHFGATGIRSKIRTMPVENFADLRKMHIFIEAQTMPCCGIIDELIDGRWPK
jgi:hypothetical protein